MVRAVLGGLLVLLSASAAQSASNPTANALRQQLKLLRSQKTAVIRAIEAQYNAVIGRGSLTEAQVASLRAAIRRQEREQLALATNTTDKETLRQQYDTLRQALSGEIAVDSVLLSQLRSQKIALIRLVNRLYAAQVRELEREIRALGRTGASSHASSRSRRR